MCQTLVRVLSLTVNTYIRITIVSKRNIRQSFEGCRQSYKMTFIYALARIKSSSFPAEVGK